MAELIKVNAPVRKPLFEGVQGENEARSIQFDITPWVDELGDGAVTATAKRSQDSQPYPVTVTKVGNVVTWKPTSTDTAFAGVGSFQLEYTVDDVLAKTCIWSTMVAPSLDPAGDPPDPYDNWLAEMREIAADAIQASQDAEDSAEDAEAWAVGQRGGVDVSSTDPTYENNAKYWAGKSEELKDDTQAIVDEARADVFEAMDGLHEETTAGSALQLISDKYTENKEPYLFRKSIAGDRELDTLVGGSVAWNQLANPQSYSGGGITYVVVNGHVTATGTPEQTGWWSMANVTALLNHVYYIAVEDYKENDSGNKLCLLGNFTQINNFKTEKQRLIVKNSSYDIWRFAFSRDTTVNYNKEFTPQLIDLTQMFGTAVADRLYAMEQAQSGSGVALFRSWFPKDYYAYNTGELMSVKTSAHEIVGFNQWDEQWETGTLDKDTGEIVYHSSQIRSKDFIPTLPNTEYFLYCGLIVGQAGNSIPVYFYDSEKNYLGKDARAIVNSSSFTTPQNAYYMKFRTGNEYGATYKNDICINLSSDRNGEYEPYQKRTYALDDIELRGVMKVDANGNIYFDGDEYTSDGTVARRFGIVDLGTLEWRYSSTIPYFGTTITGIKRTATWSAVVDSIVQAKYTPTYADNLALASSADKAIAVSPSADTLIIRDTTYTDTADFKTAMNGVYLVYELATPTTETADPFTSPQIVDAYGTERYVDERTVAVPVGHVTKYPDNLREKLDGLPWDFSSLIAPTEKAYTATRNYTTGSLFIVGNVLYKATANIANGGTITPNTNCTATTLAEVISAL